MVRKKLYKFIAMILTGSVLLTQPGVIQMAGTVPVYAEEAAEQAEAASVSSSEAEGEVNSSEENTGDEASGDSTSETNSEDTSATSSEEETTGEEQTEESKESMDSEVPSGSSSESADQKENAEEKKDTEAAESSGMSDEEFLASVMNDLEGQNENGSSPSPEKITAAIGQFISALDKIFGQKPGGSDSIQKLLADLNGVGIGANSIIAFLKIAGIMKDPTTESLQNILNMLQNQNEKLQKMDETLNTLAQQLDNIQYEQQKESRQQAAIHAKDAYALFKILRMDPLAMALDTYLVKMQQELYEWSTASTETSSLAVYYTVIDHEKTAAFSNASKDKTSVSKSDDAKTIYTNFTIELPQEYVKKALEKYQDQLTSPDTVDTSKLLASLKNSIIEAADNDKILVATNSNFYLEWKKYSDQEKDNRAEEIAEGLYNNLVYTISSKYAYKISHDGMSTLNTMRQNYILFCRDLFDPDSGLNAYFTSMTNLYAFEGEISQNVQLTVYSFYASVVFYGAFIMTLMRQVPSMRSCIPDIQTSMVEASTNVQDFLANNLGRGDNFCYVTKSLVTFEERTISSQTAFTTEEYRKNIIFSDKEYIRYVSTKADPITISGSNKDTIVQTNDLRMIYDVYKAFGKTDTTSFSQYMNGNKTEYPADFAGSIVTKFREMGTFPLLDNIPMTAYKGQYHESWSMYGGYSDGQVYKIDARNQKNSHWDVHDSVTGDLVTISEGILTYKNKQTLFSRAAFSHHDSKWAKDHIWYFSDSPTTSEGVDLPKDLYYERRFYSSKTIYTLAQTPVQKKTEVSGDCDEDVCLNILDHMIFEFEESNAALQETESTVEENNKSLDDWISYDQDILYADCSEEEVEDFFKSYIDYLAWQGVDGTAIKLSDNSKTSIFDAISKKITKVWEEYCNNENLDFSAYCDPFNIYGNETAMTELAKEVLLNCYKDEDGNPLIPVENMITVAIIEPLASLNFKKEDGKTKAVVGNVVDVEPMLFIWDSPSDSYMCFKISNEVMEKLGLSMDLRLSAASLGDSTKAKVIHYDDYDTMNEVERFTVDVQGSGNNRYVEVKVASCSPFAVVSTSDKGEDADDENGGSGSSGNNGSKGSGSSSSGSSSAKGGTSSGSSAKGTSNVKTGDTTNVVPYIILLLAAAACLGGIVIYRRKKQ